MKDSMIIEGNEYISSRRAAEITRYSNDYIGQLCRAGKINGRVIGRTWFIEKKSLLSYKSSADVFNNTHGRKLTLLQKSISSLIPPKAVPSPLQSADDHKQPLALGASSAVPPIQWKINYLPDDRALLPVLNKKSTVVADVQTRVLTHSHFGRRLQEVAASVAMLAIVTMTVYALSYPADLKQKLSVLRELATAVISNPFEKVTNTASVVDSAIGTVGGWWSSVSHGLSVVVRNWLGIGDTGLAVNNNTTVLSTTTISSRTSSSSATARSVIVKPQTTIINNFDPSILSRLSNLELNVSAFKDLQTLQNYALGDNIGRSISRALQSISINASGGTTGLSFSGGPINISGVFTLGGTLAVGSGGTGTSTAPSYGQVLVGNSASGYDFMATSSLNITAASTTVLADSNTWTGLNTWTGVNNFAGGFLAGASSTINSSLHLPSISTGGLAVDGTGLVYSFATSTWTFASSTLLADSNTFSGNNTFSGDTILNTLTVNSSVKSDLVPDVNNMRDIGSPAFFWKDAFIDTLTANNISAASTTIGGTKSETFTINSDNVSADAEAMSLIFYRGTVVPNAVIAWDNVNDYFDFNQPMFFQNQSTSLGTPSLEVRGATNQTADILRIATSTGGVYFSIANNGDATFSNTVTGSITGNAGTATALQTARAINGVSFNGTADITITAASSTLLANNNTWTGTNAFAGLTATSFNLGSGLANMLAGFDASGNLTSTSTPTAAAYLATSTTATSTFAGGLVAGTNNSQLSNIYVDTGGNTSIGSTLTLRESGGTAAKLVASNGNTTFLQYDGLGNVILNTYNSTRYIDLQEGGVSRLFIDNSGNGFVGIGTTSPYAKLSVDGRGVFNQDIRADYYTATSTSIASTFPYASSTALTVSGSTYLTGLSAGGVSVNSSGLLYSFATSTWTFASSTLLTNSNTWTGTNTFSTLNMGTGVASMLAGFDASGNLTSTSTPQVAVINATSTTATSTFSGGLIAGVNSSALSNLYVSPTTGRVGIGTTSPTYRLEVAGSDSALLIKGVSGNGLIYFDNPNRSTDYTIGSSNNSNQLNFSYGSTLTMVLNTGSVGIATTSTPGRLSIDAGGNSTTGLLVTGVGNQTAALSAFRGGGSGPQGDLMQFQDFTGSTVYTVVNKNGWIGIGTTTPYAKLSVAGGTSGTAIATDMASGYTGNILELKVASSTVFAVNQAGAITSTGLSLGSGFANMLAGFDASGNLTSTSSPQVAYINATSTTATSTFSGGIIGPNNFTVQQTSGNVGIGTASPGSTLDVASGQVLLPSGSVTSPGISFRSDSSFNTGLYLVSENVLGLTSGGSATWNFNSNITGQGVLSTIYTGSNGTAAAPVYSFNNGYEDTGMFKHGGLHDLGFSTAGIERLSILNTGLVGIGTTSPYAKLSVDGRGVFNQDIRADYYTATSTSIASTFPYASSTALTVSGSTYLTGLSAGGVSVNSSGLLYSFSTSTWTFASSTLLANNNTWTGTNTFGTLNATTLNMGAGLANMLAGFDASGNLTSTSSPQVAYINATSTTATSTFSGGIIGPNNFTVQQTSGNVGIGTTSPYSLLSISNSAGTAVNTPLFTIASTTAGTATSTLVTVLANGNVGIATTAPAYKLDVNGSVRLSSITAVAAPLSIISGISTYSFANNGFLSLTGFFTSNLESLNANMNIFVATGGSDQSGGNVNITGLSPTAVYSSPNGRNVIINGGTPFGAGLYGNVVLSNNGGKVGIGTTTPNWLLQVNGTSPSLALSDSSAGTNLKHWLLSSMGGNLYVGTSTDSYGTSTPAAFTILNNGNIGIGQASPTYKLDVTGNGHFTSLVDADHFVATSTSVASIFAGGINVTGGNLNLGSGLANMLAGFDASGNLTSTSSPQVAYINATSTTATSTFSGGLSVAGSSGLTVLQNGNVGIGTAAPATTLHVNGSERITGVAGGSNTFLTFYNTTSAIAITGSDASIYGGTATNVGFYVYGNNQFDLSTNGVKRLSVTGGGNIGIGTTSPSSKLSIYATNTSGIAGLYIAGNPSNTGSIFNISTSTASATSTAFIIDNNGKVGIGTTTPTNQLGVQGSILSSKIDVYDATATSTFAGFIDVNGTGTNATSTFASNLWVKGTLRTGTGSIYLNDTNITAGNGAFNFVTSGTSTLTNGLSALRYNATASSTLSGLVLNAGGLTISTLGSSACSGLGNGGKLTTDANGNVTCAADVSGSGASYDWLQQSNIFSVNSLTPTTTIPIWIKSTATSTFAGGIESWSLIGAPYFNATSTTATSTFAGGALFALGGGNVGIGTSSPLSTLSIAGPNTITDGPSTLYVSNAGGAGFAAIFNAMDGKVDGSGYTSIQMRNDANDKLQAMEFGISGTQTSSYSGNNSDAYFGNTGAFDLSLITDNTARLTIDGTGYVGINQTSPYYQLDVNGTIGNSVGDLSIRTHDGDGGSTPGGAGSSGLGDVATYAGNGGAGGDGDGGTGGGTGGNGKWVSLVAGNGGDGGADGGAGAGNGGHGGSIAISAGNGGATAAGWGGAYGGDLSLNSGNASADSNGGNVNIGAGSTDDGSGGSITLTAGNSGSGGGGQIHLNVGSSNDAYLAIDGLEGNAFDDYVCYANVSKHVGANSGSCGASSIRFKQNVENLTNSSGLAFVRQLRPVSYEFIAKPGEERVGFIAEEINKLDTRLVTYEQDGVTPHGLRYQEFVVPLALAMQELDTRVGSLIGTSATSTLAMTDSLKNISNAVAGLNLRVDTLVLKTDSVGGSLLASTTFMDAIASSTADTLASSTPSFVYRIASAVLDLLKSVGDLVISKITSVLAVFNRVETQTAAVTNGLEMTDSATGQVYCVRITNGDFAKTPGTCTAVASSTQSIAQNVATTTTPATAPTSPTVVTISPVTTPDQQMTVNAPNTSTGTTTGTNTTLTATTTDTTATSTDTTTASPAPTNTSTTTDTTITSPSVTGTPTPSAGDTTVSSADSSSATAPTDTDTTTATTPTSSTDGSTAPAPAPAPAPTDTTTTSSGTVSPDSTSPAAL